MNTSDANQLPDQPDNQPINQLDEYVEKVDEMLVKSEEQLRAFANDGQKNATTPDLETILETYTDFEANIPHIKTQFEQWSQQEHDIREQCEITRSLGQIKRLSLVIKNILKLTRKSLGIIDPDQHDELLQQLNIMNGLHHQ